MLPSQLEMDVDTNGLTEVLTFDERTPKLTGRLDRTAEENRSAAASQPPPTTVRLIDQSAAAHGVAPGLGGPSEQWLWAAASAHHMLFSFAFHIFCCQPQRDARMAAAEWRRYRLLAWNPLYWLAWLPTVVAIAVGRWFHAFFGQHNAIDEHETDLEFQARDARNSSGNAAQFSQRRCCPLQVRVWWLYFADGAMLLLGVVGLLGPLLTWAEEEMGMCGKPGASSCSVDGAALQMGFDEAVRHRRRTIRRNPSAWPDRRALLSPQVALCYLLGNVAFLRAMRRRDQTLVRAFISGNLAFALVLATLLVASVYASASRAVAWNATRELAFTATWFWRGFIVGWIVVGASAVSRHTPVTLRLHSHHHSSLQASCGTFTSGRTTARAPPTRRRAVTAPSSAASSSPSSPHSSSSPSCSSPFASPPAASRASAMATGGCRRTRRTRRRCATAPAASTSFGGRSPSLFS